MPENQLKQRHNLMKFAALMAAFLISPLACNKEESGTAHPPAVTAARLGLVPGTKEMGPDKQGRWWFRVPLRDENGHEIPGKFQQQVYNSKNHTLYAAVKQPDGKWKLNKVERQPQ